MTYRKQIILQIDDVQKEYRAAAIAVSEFHRRVSKDPTVLRSANVLQKDIRACWTNLEVTYLVRTFAVFEEALRDVRRLVYRRTSPIKTFDLIQQCAARQHIPNDELANAHRVREHRNSLMHGGIATPVTLQQATRSLCIFFARMPPKW